MSKLKKNILISDGIRNLATGIKSFLEEKHPDYHIVKLTQGDICDAEAVRQVISNHHIDTIIHMVHSLPFDGSMEECLEYTREAVYGTHVLLQEGHKAGVRLFLMASSVLENHLCQKADGRIPCRIHIANQAGAEHMAFSYWWSHQLPVVVARHVCRVPSPDSSTPCIPCKQVRQPLEQQKECSGMCSSSRVVCHDNHDAGVAATYEVLLHQGVPGQAYSIDTDYNISRVDPVPQALPLHML